MTFEKIMRKLKGKTLSDLLKAAVSRMLYLFHREFIRYNIMQLNLSTANLSKRGNVKMVAMQLEDPDKLPIDYFFPIDHEFKKLTLMRKDPLFKGFMCYDEKGVFAGYCWIMLRGSEYEYFIIQDADAYLAEFYINKAVRGRNLGPAMLLAACEILKENGVTKMKLAVRSDNLSAIRCYEKAGFKNIRTYKVIRNIRKRTVYPHHVL